MIKCPPKKRVNARCVCCRNCVNYNFTVVNFQDFVFGPLVQSTRTPVREPLLYHIKKFFSDSRDPIFIFMDPIRVPKTPKKNPGLVQNIMINHKNACSNEISHDTECRSICGFVQCHVISVLTTAFLTINTHCTWNNYDAKSTCSTDRTFSFC